MNERLEIRLLGGLEIRRNNKLVDKFASNKAKALIAYLACNPGPINREGLATMLWEDRSQERAAGNLRVLINSIRTLLAPFFEIKRQTIELILDDHVQVDVGELDAMLELVFGNVNQSPTLASADIAHLTDALALYRGEFLENFYIRGARQFDAWATFERERLHHSVVRCIESMGDYYITHDQTAEGIHLAKKLIQLEPLYESGHQQLLLLYAADNQRNSLVTHFKAFQHLLAKEHGIDPSPEIVALYQRLIEGDAAALSQPHEARYPLSESQSKDWGESSLPVELTSTIGREDEIDEIVRRLTKPDCRILTLIGPGGVGKTRMATATARRCISGRQENLLFDDGICFVPLERIDEPFLIITAIADALDITLAKETSAIVQIKSYLRRRRLLLLLDNVEHLLEGVDILLEILQAAPDVKLLTTSRERLNFLGEHLFAVQGLSYPPSLDLPSSSVPGHDLKSSSRQKDEMLLSSYFAVELFAREAAAQQTDFVLSEQYDSVAAICREVEGLPLAIQLAAASVRAFSTSQILTRIRQNIDFLQSTMRNVPERHRSLRAVFEDSWQQLTKPDQNAFRQLSVFSGSFTPDPAEQVAGVTTQLLFTLVNSSLIEQVKSGADKPIRYKIHPVLRQYAQEKLNDEPDVLRATRDRHAAFYVAFLEEYETVDEASAADALADIAIEIENCRTAWQWSVLHNRMQWARRAFPVLGTYYQLHGPFQEGSNIILAAVEELEQRSRGGQIQDDDQHQFLGELLAVLAELYNRQAAYADAVDVARRTIDLSTAQQGFDTCVKGHLAAAQGYRYQGDYDHAQRHAEQALGLASEHDMKTAVADSLMVLGTVRLYESKYDSANRALTDALSIYRELGSEQNQSRVLNVLGNLCLYQGDYSGAQNYYVQAHQRFQQLGDRQGQAQVLNNLGAVHFHLGNFQEALDTYHQALNIEQETGGMHGISLLNSNLSLLYQQMNDYEAGLRYGQSAELIAQELGARDNQAFALLCIGHARAGRQQWLEAKQAYLQATRLRTQLGQENQALEPRAGLIRVAIAENVDDSMLVDVEDILKGMQGNSLVGIVEPFRIYWTCYLALCHFNRTDRAVETLEEAYDLLRVRTESLPGSLQRHAYINSRTDRRAIMDEYLSQNRPKAIPVT